MLPAPRQTTIVAGLRDAAHQRRELFGRGQDERVAMAVRIDRRGQRLLVDALDRRLAGGVDVGDDHACRRR